MISRHSLICLRFVSTLVYIGLPLDDFEAVRVSIEETACVFDVPRLPVHRDVLPGHLSTDSLKVNFKLHGLILSKRDQHGGFLEGILLTLESDQEHLR